MNGVRSCGYLFSHLMNIGITIPPQLLSPFIRVCEVYRYLFINFFNYYISN
jgi:hypothetical protein